MADTRLGLSATPRGLYGSFAGKTEEELAPFTPKNIYTLKIVNRIATVKKVDRIYTVRTNG